VLILGIILVILGYLLPIPIISTIGWILIVLGLILLVLGYVDRPIGRRRWWY
jgi:hypothetical protein